MIFIEKKYLSEIINHAESSALSETCGILAGRPSPEGLRSVIRVEKVYKMQNTSENPEICYFMDAKEQFIIMKEIRNAGLEMLGIYHSHINSEAYPSAKDVELAYYPEAVYVIVSMPARDIRAFRIVEGKIWEETIK